MNFRGLLFVLLTSPAWAQKPDPVPTTPPPPPGGAVEALRLLPRESARRLARIEAREGRPKPERWYIIVHEPDAPRGLREFVVSGSKIVAARSLSQFADKLTLENAFGEPYLRVDSDYCAQIALAYSKANGGKAAFVNYELARPPFTPNPNPPAPPPPPPPPKPGSKPPPPPPPIVPPARAETEWPIWRLTVLDTNNDQIGMITISATRGTVLSHDGFDREADPNLMPTPPGPPPGSLYPPMPKTKPAPATKGKSGKSKK